MTVIKMLSAQMSDLESLCVIVFPGMQEMESFVQVGCGALCTRIYINIYRESCREGGSIIPISLPKLWPNPIVPDYVVPIFYCFLLVSPSA